MMDDKTNARLVEALRRRKVARFPAVEVEGRMPRPMADTPPVMTQPGYGLERSAEGLPPLVREIRTVRPGEDDLGRPVAPPVAAPVVAPPPVEDDSELEAAREADRQSRFAAGMELAGRQLVGGITRTPVPQGLGVNPSEVPLAMARAKSKREQAAELLRQRRQATMDASKLDLEKSQAEKNLREKEDGEGELASYKVVMSRRYPEAAELIAGLTTMKGTQDLQNSLDSEAGRKTTIEAARIAAGASRAEARGVREDVKATKATETEAEQAIPGHVHDPKIKVPPTKVSALRDGIADAATMQGHIAELDALVAKHGLEVVPGPVKTRMEALVRQLGIKAKGPAFAELGVLAGPDLQILDDMIGDPTNWRTAFKGGADDVRARLGVFRDAVKTNMANKKRLYGYSESGARPSGKVFRDRKTGELVEVE